MVPSSSDHTLSANWSAAHEVTVFHRGESEAGLPGQVRHVRSPLAALPVTQFPRELQLLEPEIVIHMISMGEADTRAAVSTFRGVRGAWSA